MSTAPASRLSPAAAVAIIGALAAFNWCVFRLRPGLERARTLEARRAELEKEERGLLAAAADATALEDQVAALTSGTNHLKARLAEHEARVAAPAARAELELRAVALAEATGLQLQTQGLTSSAPIALPPDALRLWTIRGSFGCLWTFLRRLPELPSRVVVLGLSLQAPQQQVLDRPEAPLTIQVTVGL